MTIDTNRAATTGHGIRHAALAALALSMLLASLGVSVSTITLPVLAREFQAPMHYVQWVILAYLLSLTATVVIGGRLGDVLGKRPVFLAGLALFAAASALSGLAPSLEMLIAARAMQGLGGAILMALPLAIARETVGKDLMGTAMGLLGTMSAVGTALGPTLAGILIAWSGWRLAFPVMAAGGLAALAFSAVAIPSDQNTGARNWRRVDIPGACVLALTLICFSLAMTGGRSGFESQQVALAAAAFASGGIFALVESRRYHPLVALYVLREQGLAGGLAANILVSAVMMTTLVVSPFFLTLGLGLDEVQAGLVLSVGPAVAALSGVPAGHLVDRFGAQPVALFGLGQIAAALTGLALLPHMLGVAGYVLPLVLLTPGFQLFLAANNTALMLVSGENQRGMVSGLLGLSRNLGFMAGASVMMALFAAAAGTRQIVDAPAAIVGRAFTVTFLAGVAMTACACLITIASLRRRNIAN